MLHIILLILKIIGIILLAIIGLLLLVFLTVLLVPIRYRVTVTHGEDFFLDGRLSWLLHLIGARITHLEGKFHIRIRVLWFTLYDNLKPRLPKVKKKKRMTSIKRRNKKNAQSRKIHKNKGKDKDINEKLNKGLDKDIDIGLDKDVNKDENKDINIYNQSMISDRNSRTYKETGQKENNKMSDSTSIIETQHETEQKNEHKKDNESLDIMKSSLKDDQYEVKGQSLKGYAKISIFQKIINKINSIKEKVLAFFREIKQKILKWLETVTKLKNKLDLVLDFTRNEINKEGFRITYASLKRLLKHMLPTKLKSRVYFGTGDPCSTGQALAVLGFLYSIYGDKVVIIPDFENKRLEGEHIASGRIRLITILIIVIKLILNKRFKQLKNNFQILKEAL